MSTFVAEVGPIARSVSRRFDAYEYRELLNIGVLACLEDAATNTPRHSNAYRRIALNAIWDHLRKMLAPFSTRKRIARVTLEEPAITFDELRREAFLEAVRTRLEHILKEESSILDVLLGYDRPRNYAQRLGMPIVTVRNNIRRVRYHLQKDPELVELWKELDA